MFTNWDNGESDIPLVGGFSFTFPSTLYWPILPSVLLVVCGYQVSSLHLFAPSRKTSFINVLETLNVGCSYYNVHMLYVSELGY